ncbi:GEVED domain-containing protein [Acaryochloris sp. IP29b_bin.137]|uniref:GEVED domain-containing protein n=1 Tax=Acaryochloris sp. IP29b_bin.137 TaxID=2969217 RepID=UPI002606E8F5|nr:GEVED domain-containing protein [Acaryochloris sp. IP29b_bin.137]
MSTLNPQFPSLGGLLINRRTSIVQPRVVEKQADVSHQTQPQKLATRFLVGLGMVGVLSFPILSPLLKLRTALALENPTTSPVNQPVGFLPAPNPTAYCESPTYFDHWNLVNPNADGTVAGTAQTEPGGIVMTVTDVAGVGGGLRTNAPAFGIIHDENDDSVVTISEPLFYSQWVFVDVDLSQEGFFVTGSHAGAPPSGVAVMASNSSFSNSTTTGTITADQINGVGRFNVGPQINGSPHQLEKRFQVDFLGTVSRVELDKIGTGGAGFSVSAGCQAIGIAKEVGPVSFDNQTGEYNFTYTLRVVNNLPTQAEVEAVLAAAEADNDQYEGPNTAPEIPITDLQVTDDLAAVFGAGNFTVSNVNTGTLTPNPNGFDGNSETELLAAGQGLAPKAEHTITFDVTYTPPGGVTLPLTLQNQATVSGVAGGVAVSDQSDNGSNPGPGNENGSGGTNDPTPVQLVAPPEDFGDAPDSYTDASHTISPSLYLGSVVPDGEADTQLGGDAGDGADGDDGDGTDDEDGVIFSPTLGFPNTVHVVQAGISNTVDVVASDTGILNAWIDYNQDGDFDDPGEQIFTNENLSAGNNSLSFNPAVTLLHGPTYARFRFSSQSDLGPTGSATDGEVEDYEVNIAAPVSDINACAVTGLVDGEFEQLDISQGTPTPVNSFGSTPTLSRQYNETDVPGWNFAGTSTPPLDDIEIWQSQHGGGQDPFDAFEGGQHAEINAEEDGILFQDVVTTPGATMGWQFAHRGRTGNDTMEFRLGPPGTTISQGTFNSGNNVNDPNEGWQLYNGSYTVPANQYVTRIEFRAVSTANGDIRTGNFLDAVDFNLPPCIPPFNPNLLLVKRITRINGSTNSNGGDDLAAYKQEEAYIYDDNTIETTTPPTPPDTDRWPNTTGKDSSTFLIGGTDGGRTKPGDEIEYTIYFLSTGNIDAVNTQICDRVPDFQSYVPDAFNSVTPGPNGGVGANRGIVVEYNGDIFSYSNNADGDIARFYPPGSALPAACNGAAAQDEDNGAIVVELGNLPHATSAGIPKTSFGAVRFRARVK